MFVALPLARIWRKALELSALHSGLVRYAGRTLIRHPIGKPLLQDIRWALSICSK